MAVLVTWLLTTLHGHTAGSPHCWMVYVAYVCILVVLLMYSCAFMVLNSSPCQATSSRMSYEQGYLYVQSLLSQQVGLYACLAMLSTFGCYYLAVLHVAVRCAVHLNGRGTARGCCLCRHHSSLARACMYAVCTAALLVASRQSMICRFASSSAEHAVPAVAKGTAVG